jgi:phage-related holin
MALKSPLEDPEQAAFAWARYKRLMYFMVAVTLATVVGALVLLSQVVGEVSIHFYIATGLGIAGAMMLMSALMGLVFLSDGTGHDHTIDDRSDRQG